MNNTIGQAITLTLFGESHGAEIGAVLDGIAPGLPVDEGKIADALARRRPKDELSTKRREPDAFRIVAGVIDGHTTGTPLTLLIPNTAAHSEDYRSEGFLPRPSHADYPAFRKYHGYEDRRGGGHFSGRLTAPLVAVGAVLLSALEAGGVNVHARISSLAGIRDEGDFGEDADRTPPEVKDFPVLSDAAGERMKDAVRAAARDGDSVGGTVEVFVTGVPAGLGEPWFDTMEGELSKILFSVPAVKGVAFGDGFSLAAMRGSEANDPFALQNGRVVTLTNHSGGIGGGITNGMPLRFSVAIKPTPSIFRPQRTVDPIAMTEEELTVHGRHDPTVVHRALPVLRAVCAFVLCDFLVRRYGTDSLVGGRFSALAKSEGCL